MEIFYILFSAFFVIFFPRQITHLICFGRHRDRQNVTSRAAYCGIYLFWTIIFLVLCMFMGSGVGIETPMDKVIYYVVLETKDKDYIGEPSKEEDEVFILTYHTNNKIDESILMEIIQDNKSLNYEYDLQGISLTELNGKKWKMSINGKELGEVDIKKGFLVKDIYFIWNEKNLEWRKIDYAKEDS